MVNDGPESSTSFAAASDASDNGSRSGVSVVSSPVVTGGLSFVGEASLMFCSEVIIGAALSRTPAAWVSSALSFFWMFSV